jgi:membrane protein DedA with SNARE-associated domain
MTDWLLGLVPVWGTWLVMGATFASCLALPVPSSVVMLAAGGFAASGDLVLSHVVTAALAGATAGDQAGFLLARRGGAALAARLAADPGRAVLVARSSDFARRRGTVAVFLSRWLLSPLGPWVNLAAGVSDMGWISFTLAGVAGEAVWVGLYVGTGLSFAGNLAAAAEAVGNLMGFVFAGALALGLGWLLWRTLHGAEMDQDG